MACRLSAHCMASVAKSGFVFVCLVSWIQCTFSWFEVFGISSPTVLPAQRSPKACNLAVYNKDHIPVYILDVQETNMRLVFFLEMTFSCDEDAPINFVSHWQSCSQPPCCLFLKGGGGRHHALPQFSPVVALQLCTSRHLGMRLSSWFNNNYLNYSSWKIIQNLRRRPLEVLPLKCSTKNCFVQHIKQDLQ